MGNSSKKIKKGVEPPDRSFEINPASIRAHVDLHEAPPRSKSVAASRQQPAGVQFDQGMYRARQGTQAPVVMPPEVPNNALIP